MLNLFKPFMTPRINAEGKKQELLKPDLDKVFVHHDYQIATNGVIALKLNGVQEIEEPYLIDPKTNEKSDASECTQVKVASLVENTSMTRREDEAIHLTPGQVHELIDVHLRAKICKHPCFQTTWGDGAITSSSSDGVCKFKHNYPDFEVRVFSYNADNMLKILRVVKRFKEGCTLYPKPLSPILFTFAGHEAILMPIKKDE